MTAIYAQGWSPSTVYCAGGVVEASWGRLVRWWRRRRRSGCRWLRSRRLDCRSQRCRCIRRGPRHQQSHRCEDGHDGYDERDFSATRAQPVQQLALAHAGLNMESSLMAIRSAASQAWRRILSAKILVKTSSSSFMPPGNLASDRSQCFNIARFLIKGESASSISSGARVPSRCVASGTSQRLSN
jgi:hypothetical protein